MLDVRSLRTRPHLTFLTVLAVTAALFAGCGQDSGGRKLSRESAVSLRATLDQIQQDVSAGDCTTANQEVGTLRQKVDSLSSVDRGLRRALVSSTDRLRTLVADQCETATPAPAAPQTPETGTTDQQKPPGKDKNKKDKQKTKDKGNQPPGLDGQTPPGQQNDGGGAGLPGESNPGGGD
jgi:hypothetical protein